MSKNTTDLNILDLAKKLQCHSHGYMCQDCPQPDETEIVKLLEQLISNREKLARIEELDRFHLFRTDDGSNERYKHERLQSLRKELDGGQSDVVR